MTTIEMLKSYRDTPDPLRLLCLNSIIKKPVNLNVKLPCELGELIALAYRDYTLANPRAKSLDSVNFFRHFKHKFTPLKKIDFSGLPITESFFIEFLQEYRYELSEINISKCSGLIRMDLKRLNELLKSNRDEPKTLIIGETFSGIIEERRRFQAQERLFDDDLKLKKLVLHKVPISEEDEFTINRQLSRFISPTMSNSLRHLDLSMCSIGKGSALMQLHSLEVLILYECPMTYPDVILTISQLTKLRVLDLSRQVKDTDYSSPVSEDPELLSRLVSKLPQLASLDISGTNLVGGKDRSIPAFDQRIEMNNWFSFLGLFHTGNDAAYRSCIPAKKIAGEATEAQMLNACEAYTGRSTQLLKALNDLYNFYKNITPSETFGDVKRALDVILPILTIHLDNEQVIIYTTATLWCIVKINVTLKNLNDARLRRTITSRLLDVMHYHKKSSVILINGGLTLLFLPDIICEHSRVAEISLLMCKDSDPRTLGFGTTLLNTLACQVGGDQKIFIGKLAAIETMINIIHTKIESNVCDEILETAWSTLWNITDETPVNCSRFIEHNGLEAFERCMDKFGNNKEVLRNMMGLLGNIAECESLRVKFMKESYIRRFCILLVSDIDGIECSYNACGILAHLISDGKQFWDEYLKHCVDRDLLLAEMRAAISKWPINSRRNINYRSFKPIVKLIEPNVDAEAQYWAVFALTNLTRINPAKYCPMLLPHNGLAKLRHLTTPGVTKPFVTNLAVNAVFQYEKYEANRTLDGLEQCDSLDMEVVGYFKARPLQVDGSNEYGDLY